MGMTARIRNTIASAPASMKKRSMLHSDTLLMSFFETARFISVAFSRAASSPQTAPPSILRAICMVDPSFSVLYGHCITVRGYFQLCIFHISV